jgi:hypothetical protein
MLPTKFQFIWLRGFRGEDKNMKSYSDLLISEKIFSVTSCPNEQKLGRKHLSNVLYKDCLSQPDSLTNMASTDNYCFWLADFKKSSPLQPLGLNRNLVWSIYGSFSMNIAHFIQIRVCWRIGTKLAIFKEDFKRTYNRYFLPSFRSFGHAVLEEKMFTDRPIRHKNGLWWPCLLTDLDEMSNVHREAPIYASH